MKRLTGIVLFVGCCIGSLVCFYGLSETYSEWVERDSSSALKGMLIIILILIALASGIYYTIVTKFGSSKPAILESLERENEIIRKQIEKRELLSKLEAFEKNE